MGLKPPKTLSTWQPIESIFGRGIQQFFSIYILFHIHIHTIFSTHINNKKPDINRQIVYSFRTVSQVLNVGGERRFTYIDVSERENIF